MKQFYSFWLVAILSVLSTSYAAAFVPKAYSYTAVGVLYQLPINIYLDDLFEYPEGLPIATKLTDVATITFESENPDLVNLSSFSYNDYYQRTSITLFQKPNNAGDTKVIAKIVYEGKEYTNELNFSIKRLIAADDKAVVEPGKSITVDVIKNDATMGTRNGSTLEILKQPSHGTVKVVKATNYDMVEYTPNSNVGNYTKDELEYKVTDPDGYSSTAKLTIDIHLYAYATKVFDFLPAPGQFTNEAAWGLPSAKNNVLGETTQGVSLGGWGGYVIVGFDQPIVNRPENPYGVDFTIVGNAMSNWSEPAAVMVMKDLNGNGLPDDGEWYELAGSEYYFKNTIKNMRMTYVNPKYDKRYTVPFYTDKGTSGALLTNQFHNHPFYPDPFEFGISPDSISYTGTFTPYLLDKSKRGYVEAKKLPIFGYADSKVANPTPTYPRNPYYTDEKGVSADGFDLSWAVDKFGNPVELDEVHFVKIYSTTQEDGGWLGEVSPEVFKIAITTPDPNYAPKDYYVHGIASAPLQILKGSEHIFEGLLYKNGKPQEGSQTWTSSDLAVGSVNNEGVFNALGLGKTTISFSQKEDTPPATINIEVVELQNVVIELEGNTATNPASTSLIEDEIIFITAQGEDNRTAGANRFVYENYIWTSSDENVGTINKGQFKGLKTGTTTVTVQSTSNPSLSRSIEVNVAGKPELTIKDDLIELEESKREGSFKAKDLFNEAKSATIFFKAVTVGNKMTRVSTELLEAEIEKNILSYSFNEGQYGTEKLLIDVEYFNKVSTYALFLNSKSLVSIDEVVAEDKINVYPNPFVSGINICLEDAETAQVIISSIVGQILVKKTVSKNDYIDLSSYPTGQYVIVIKTNTGKTFNKVILKK